MADNEAFLRAESQGALITSLAIIFVILSTTSVILRLYTRKRVLDVCGADDATIVVAQVLAVVVSIVTILQAHFGLGRHTNFVDPETAVKQLKLLYASTLIYNAAQTTTKISFLILYRRLFPEARTSQACFYLLLFIVAWGLTQEFIVGFSCTPLSDFRPQMKGKCIYTLPVWFLTSCINIATDFLIFVVPMRPLLKLQLRMEQKALLLALFCLGFFTCIISLVRLSVLHKGATTMDPFWDNAPAAYWSVVELNCGILCSCLPTLRPLVRRFVPQSLTSDGDSHSGKDGLTNRHSSVGDMCSVRELEDGIYMQKEIEMQSMSTAELAKRSGVIITNFEDTMYGKEIVAQSSKGQLRRPT